MSSERDHLRSVVFLTLEEKLRKRFHFLEPIDLRMGIGVTEIPERDLVVLRVCLDEIKRSRPFFIGILGDRYGWVPPLDAAKAVAGDQQGVAGKSVTALEIELGALADPAQMKFSRFYFREPLPYKTMPRKIAARYSDEYCTDSEADRRIKALTTLKRLIMDRMGNRVRSYAAGWDKSVESVAGLAEWGAQVEADLWEDLEAATRADERSQPQTWQEREDLILEEFVAGCCREHVGREGLLDELLRFAYARSSKDPWLAFVTGDAGSGKSSLFGEMVRRLKSDPNLVVLAHSAGISAQSSGLATMLGRWNATLARAAAMPQGTVTPEGHEMGRQFAALLDRVARDRRVVCLIDALDRFEQTDAARYLQWLPRDWPANARLIITTKPGTNVDALARSLEAKVLNLGGMSAQDARMLIDASCEQHHAALSEEVKAALASTDHSGGAKEGRSPLWLHLALLQLLILETNDLAEAQRRYTGAPERRLQSFRYNMARQFPGTADGLYDRWLDRMASTYGRGWLERISELVAVSRHGLREADLRSTVPSLVQRSWSELDFADLRRGFRGELVQRGPFGQWDFLHAQARRSIERCWLGDEALVRSLHRLVAYHLKGLPEEDALRQSELMYHLIEADLPDSAAEYCAGIKPRTEVEVRAATQALASAVVQGEGMRPNFRLRWVVSLPGRPSDPFRVQAICAFFLDYLLDALAECSLDSRLALLEAVCGALERVRAERSIEAVAQRELAVGLDRWGELLGERGSDEEALGKYEDALRLREALWGAAPDSQKAARDVSVSLDRLMGHAMKTGRLELAEELCRKDLAVAELLYERFPGDATERDLFVSSVRVGDLLARKERDADALAAYEQARQSASALAQRDAQNDARARDLAAAQERCGKLRDRTGDHTGAAGAYAAALAIREGLLRKNPENYEDARDLMALCGLAADLHLGRYVEFLHRAYEISGTLYQRRRGRPETARDHAVSAYRLAAMCQAVGLDQQAVELNSECRNLIRGLPQALIESDPDLIEIMKHMR
jgi:tetratricopeptide (TPR) repeat protein